MGEIKQPSLTILRQVDQQLPVAYTVKIIQFCVNDSYQVHVEVGLNYFLFSRVGLDI